MPCVGLEAEPRKGTLRRDQRSSQTSTWLATIALTLAATPVAFAQGSKRFDVFMENWTRAEEAREAGDFASAAESYQKVFEYAKFEPSSRFLLARCLARLGEKDHALAELAKAVEYGWSDAEAIARTEPDLESLRGDARMDAVVSVAKVCAGETVLCYRGSSAEPSERVPLVVVLHGLGDTPRGNFAYWKEVADKLGLVVVAPYGVTKLGNGMSRAWHLQGGRENDLDLRASRAAIDRAIKRALEESAVDEERIILAGFSQGGALALRVLAEKPDRFAGAAAMCPIYKSLGKGFWRQATRRGQLKVHLIVGKLDRWYQAGTQAYEEMKAGGVDVEYVLHDKMGHEMPVDYVEQQTEALKFILQTK